MSIETGGPAFPESDSSFGGMTLRDYFAAKAMQAIIATYPSPAVIIQQDAKTMITLTAYAMADHMLEARK